MATTMIKNKLGNKTYTSYWPCDADAAKGLCDVALQGTWQVFEKIGETGNETVTDGYFDVFVMLQSNETKQKTYLNFAMPLKKNENDIFDALQGKTINNVKADKVYIIKMRKISLAK